ncbi:MAG: hypothetical protein ACYC6Y_29775, partial [Thermoguttaceae bacterium]
MADPSSAEFHEPKGISLSELTQAYAQAMAGGAARGPEEPAEAIAGAEEPAEILASEVATEAVQPDKADEAEGGELDEVPVSPLSVVEALLFVGNLENRPLQAAKAAELMRGVTPGDVAQLIEELNGRYRSNGCPYTIV